MLEAARKINELVDGCSRQTFDDNEVLQLALRYLVQIIGEAAYHVTKERKMRYPGIPWVQIIGMRHHLVHGYSAIDQNVLWVAATENVPPLMTDLEKLMNEEFG